jgi:hypothetical protein
MGVKQYIPHPVNVPHIHGIHAVRLVLRTNLLTVACDIFAGHCFFTMYQQLNKFVTKDNL